MQRSPSRPLLDTLRSLFLDDLLSRPLSKEKQTGGLADRSGNTWVVFDIDGTREAARQRALPQTEALPPPFRRLDDVCAPGYTGRVNVSKNRIMAEKRQVIGSYTLESLVYKMLYFG